MEAIIYAFFAALGALTYKVFIQPDFCIIIPANLCFIIFSIIWSLILYAFIFCKNSITKMAYRTLKNSFYGNDSKEKLFCISIFCFLVAIIASCCIYDSVSISDIYFSDWISFIASVITIIGIPSLFSGFFIKNEIIKTEKDTVSDSSYSVKESIVLSSPPAGFKIGDTLHFMQASKSSTIEITDKNSRGYKVVLTDTPVFKEYAKFNLDSKGKILRVANYLRKMTGDNLWLEMNRWYKSPYAVGNYYPLINAQENDWHGNEEWSKQLDAFINYLKEMKQLSYEEVANEYNL